MPERVIIVEDDRELRELLVDLLTDAGHETAPYGTADEALRALAAGEPADLVITDLVLPGMQGDELLRRVRAARAELNVIVITAFGSIESAIELVKMGAYDYVTKPFPADELRLAVDRALGESQLRRQLAAVTRGAGRRVPGLIGASTSMGALVDLIVRAAHTSHPVLITGETGTGKELVARAVHELSGRGPFVALNCGAVPEQLLEAELFGFERGAFTGADRAKPGLLEAAQDGTAFLDEIGELPVSLQPKLLRALEDGEVRRLGATAARSIRFRVIAATHRDLEQETEAGTFRQDLFWRLNVLHVPVPPLRARGSDIPLLAEHFLQEVGRERPSAPRRIAPAAMAVLMRYHWPGNVRELRNAILRAGVTATGEEIIADDLPARVRESFGPAELVAAAAQRDLPLDEVERTYILEVLRRTDGNKSRAAEILGLDRKTLYRKLQEYGRDAGEPA